LEKGDGLKAKNKTTRRMKEEKPDVRRGKTLQKKEKLKKDGERNRHHL
jgi:hypothetical protein